MACIGVPKTVDNDLPLTDCCPGFGSVAKYIAVSTREGGAGRRLDGAHFHQGVRARSDGTPRRLDRRRRGLAGRARGEAPHLILFPEIPFDQPRFLARVGQCVQDHGYCVIVVSEGTRHADGRFLAEAGTRDAFGHTQLGGVGPVVANLVRESLGFKFHWAVADYLQRAARHVASRTDVEQAYAVGKAAVEYALAGQNAVMPAIRRRSSRPYRWDVVPVPLAQVANVEKTVPRHFITQDGFGITAACRRYLEPLIAGEDYPPYRDGLPAYVRIRGTAVRRRLRTRYEI